MASLESVSEERVQSEVSNAPLIGGIPDEIALLCLARVPRRYHHILRSVSKRWRDSLCSELWHSCRQKNNLEETWVYVVARNVLNGNCCLVLDLDPARRCWKLLQVIPTPCSDVYGICVEAVGKKLYVVGGSRCCSGRIKRSRDVHCYDANKNKWELAASIPAARCYAVSASLDGKLYVTRGVGVGKDSQNLWHIYDSSSNCWSSCRNPTLNPDILKFVPFDGKLYTIHRDFNGLLFAGVYDPSCRLWQGTKNEIAKSLCGPTVAVDGTLYMLDETLGRGLMMWKEESEDWVPLARLSHELRGTPCKLVAIGRSICVIGHGLSAAVIDVDDAAEARGMLVDSSVLPNIDYRCHIISCQTITI